MACHSRLPHADMVSRALGLGLTTSVTMGGGSGSKARVGHDGSAQAMFLPEPHAAYFGLINEATAVASARSVSVTLPL